MRPPYHQSAQIQFFGQQGDKWVRLADHLTNHTITTALVFLLMAQTIAFGQGIGLQSSKHGHDLIYGINVSKEAIIDDTMFADGKDEKVDIIRFDNVGTTIWGDGPLIISSKEPIRVDSLGLTPLKLQVDSLRGLIHLTKDLDTKIYRRLPSEYLFRVTYRFEGNIYQYYIAGAESSTDFFKKIEHRIMKMSTKEALRKFYHFLGSSRLLKRSSDGPKWIY